jgi:peptidoglycan/LPS O-acetylase OafA/YrhL
MPGFMKGFKLSEGNSDVLDLIRGVSAQAVVVGHGIAYFSVFNFLHQPGSAKIQSVAVLVFFLLSGFLITYSVSSKKSHRDYSFGHFFIDRFSRIYTAFIPAILIVALIDGISICMNNDAYRFPEAFTFRAFAGNIFMLQDFPFFNQGLKSAIPSFGSARPFWSLAIEWWIYLFFGYLVLVFCTKKKINVINLVVLGLFSLVPLYNLIGGRGNGLTVYWAFGAIIFLIYALDLLSGIKRYIKIFLLFSLLLLACCRISSTHQEYEPIFAFLLVLILWITLDVFRNVQFSPFFKRIIRLNASFSYTLYLIHYSVLEFAKTHFGESGNRYLLFAASFLFSNLLSLAIGHISETILTNKVKKYLYKLLENRRTAKILKNI